VLHWDRLLASLTVAVTLTVILCCPHAIARNDLAIGEGTLVAEAGSTGGSIGKRDKSISDTEAPRTSVPDVRSSPPANRDSGREESFPKAIQLNEHAFGMNWSITLHNVGGNNYQGTWSHGYVSKFAVTAFTRGSMKMERANNPAVGAVTGSYAGSRTGNRAMGEASISNGATSKWDASW
jgi:hypothetical protein